MFCFISNNFYIIVLENIHYNGDRLQVFWINSKLEPFKEKKEFFFSKKCWNLRELNVTFSQKNKLFWEEKVAKVATSIHLDNQFSRHFFPATFSSFKIFSIYLVHTFKRVKNYKNIFTGFSLIVVNYSTIYSNYVNGNRTQSSKSRKGFPNYFAHYKSISWSNSWLNDLWFQRYIQKTYSTMVILKTSHLSKVMEWFKITKMNISRTEQNRPEIFHRIKKFLNFSTEFLFMYG